MAKTVNDVATLQRYLVEVMRKTDHHAPNVDVIALALAGAIIWKKDEDHDIRVMEKDGEMKNVLWVYINGIKYAFSYNHHQGTIEMREGSVQGRVLHSFTNAMSNTELINIFESLKN